MRLRSDTIENLVEKTSAPLVESAPDPDTKVTQVLAAAALSLALLLVGCAHEIAPTTAPAVNVYSSYDSRIPGTWIVVVDSGTRFHREIKPSTYICSAHSYPFDSGDTIRASVIQTLQSVFDDASERTSHPSHDEMARQDFAGVILVRLESFQPRLACHQGFWSATCTATTDISLGVEVNGPRGRLLGTSVGSSKTFDGDAGAACGDAANVFAESYRLALRDALERLAERVSNAPRLRAAADGSRRDSLREPSAP